MLLGTSGFGYCLPLTFRFAWRGQLQVAVRRVSGEQVDFLPCGGEAERLAKGQGGVGLVRRPLLHGHGPFQVLLGVTGVAGTVGEEPAQEARVGNSR